MVKESLVKLFLLPKHFHDVYKDHKVHFIADTRFTQHHCTAIAQLPVYSCVLISVEINCTQQVLHAGQVWVLARNNVIAEHKKRLDPDLYLEK